MHNELRNLLTKARRLLTDSLKVIANTIVRERIAGFLGKPHNDTREDLERTRSVLIEAADENTVMRAPIDIFLSTTGVPG